MRLLFDRLDLENFKTFAGKHRFDLRSRPYGLHFMRGRNLQEKRLGSNGAGKSSIWDALVWCLFGRTISGLRNPDIRPWKGKGATKVTLWINQSKIMRSASPNRLEIDGKDAGQEQVEKLIGMNFDLFTNTIVLGQGRPLFFDLPPREKMQLFVSALQLDRWDDRSGTASDRVSHLSNKAMRIEGEITALEGALEQADDLIAQQLRKSKEWEQERRSLVSEAGKNLKSLQKQFNAEQDLRDKADLQADGAEAELRHYKKQIQEQERELLKADRRAQKAELRMQNHNDAIHLAYSRLHDLGEGDVCDRCGQSLRGTALAKHRVELKKQIKRLEKDTTFDDAYEKAEKAAKSVNKQVDTTRNYISEFQAKVDKARDDFDYHMKQAAQLAADIRSLKKALHDRESETNPHRSQLAIIKRGRADTLANLEDAEQELKELQRKQVRAQFWVKGFKDVRLYQLQEVLLELELATNAMLDEAGLVDWRVTYSAEKESKKGTVTPGLTIMIDAPHSKGKVRWESWSGGEGQRLRLVGALALSEVLLNHAGIKPDIEVLDEPTQHLAAVGTADLCEYLADRANRIKRAIYYIDHVSVESSRFASTITIVKDQHGSRIET